MREIMMRISTEPKKLLLVLAALLMTISSVAEARSDKRSKSKHFQDERSNHRNSSNHSRRANNHSNGRNERVSRKSNRRNDRNNHNSYRQYNRGYTNLSRHNYGFGHRKSYLPAGYLALTFAGLNYFYNSGSYYQRIGHEYAVIRPPLGIGLSILPAGYRTIYHGRNRYYTANGIFYSWDDNRRNYIVVNNPNTPALSRSISKNTSEQYIYPRQGQNDSQTSRDRYECYLWAVDQTGVEPAHINNQRISNELENYQRANGACLEARGYSVK
jgi:hypothetical protein